MTPDEAERIAAAIAAITESLQNFRADVMVELADLEDMVTRAEQEACEQESPATEAPARVAVCRHCKTPRLDGAFGKPPEMHMRCKPCYRTSVFDFVREELLTDDQRAKAYRMWRQ